MTDKTASRSRSRDDGSSDEESSSDSEGTLLLNKDFESASSKVKRVYKQNAQL